MDFNQPLCLYLEGLDWSYKDLFLNWERSLDMPTSSNISVSQMRDSRPIELDIKTTKQTYSYMARLNGFYLVLLPLDIVCDEEGKKEDIVSVYLKADLNFKYNKNLYLGIYSFDSKDYIDSSLSLLPVPGSIWLSPLFEMEFNQKEAVKYLPSGGTIITSPAFISD